jgi:hypothetical protein
LLALVAVSLLTFVGCHHDAPPPAASADNAAAPTPPAEPAPAPQAAPPQTSQPKAPAKHAPVAEAPKPAPPPPPPPIVKTLPAGTSLATEIVNGASSKGSKIGDAVQARVTEAVELDGITVIPAGAMISGTVTEAKPLNKIGGQAVLGIKFNSLELPGGATVPIVASIEQKGKSETGKDAGTIAGATAGGALLGRLLSKHDKTKGTLIGAAVGAAAGTGAAAATKGQEVELPPGATLSLRLEDAATVTIRP